MNDNELTQKLEAILQKRKNCVQLSSEEEKFVTETIDKMLSAKKCVRKSFESKTGEEVRKSDSNPTLKKPASTNAKFEDGKPKNRGFEGGYDSKADVTERVEVVPDNKQPDKPVRKDPVQASDKKEEKLPTEDNDGEVEASYQEEEYSNTDEKEQDINYEEDRLGRIIQNRDIVIKPVKKGVVMVGQVVKLYPARDKQQAAMVKWSDGRFSHENINDLSIYETKKVAGKKSKSSQKIEDEEYTPPVKKAEDNPKDTENSGKVPQAFLKNCSEALSEEDSELSDEDRMAVCVELWKQIMSGNISEEETSSAPQAEAPAEKNEKPTDEFMERCKASLAREGKDVENAYAVCTAAYNKFVNNVDVTKSDTGCEILVTADDMDKYCKPCADKMRKNNIKHLKINC